MLVFIVDVACRHGQGLDSVLEEKEDRTLNMAGTKDLAKSCSWHDASQHPSPACGVSNRSTRTVACVCPTSFFTFNGSNSVVMAGRRAVYHRLNRRMSLCSPDGLHFSKAGSRESLAGKGLRSIGLTWQRSRSREPSRGNLSGELCGVISQCSAKTIVS